jgi:hypothetical protein
MIDDHQLVATAIVFAPRLLVPPPPLAFGPAPTIAFGPPPTIAFPVLDAVLIALCSEAGRIELAAVLDVRSGMVRIAAVLRHRSANHVETTAFGSSDTEEPPSITAQRHAIEITGQRSSDEGGRMSAPHEGGRTCARLSRRGSRSLRGGTGRRG